MTIERMSFPKGFIIENPMEVNTVVMKEKDKFEKLPEGEYEISPPYLKRRYKYQRTLFVNSKGSGSFSRNENPQPSLEVTNVAENEGKQFLANPGDVFMIIGPGSKAGKAYLYEIIRYTSTLPKK